MRNLKKVLALVLVFAMAFTMVSFAALEDVAGSDFENQIRTNVALGIIKGKDNGNFDPTGDVTRGEMAKMIYVMLKGKDDGATIYKGETDLKDVRGHWAEGYINYCYSLNVIAGRGNGIFDPNAKVTAAEAAKMILVALGWDPDKEAYVGSGWSIRTVARAEKEDLLEGFEDLDVSAPLNREGAANMIYNGLFADTIEYYVLNDRPSTTREDSLAVKVFDLIEADAYLVATQEVGIGGASPEGTTTFEIIDDPDTDAVESGDVVVVNTTVDYENLGRIYKIHYKTEDVSRADKDKEANATLFNAVYSKDNKVIATTGNNFSLERDGMFSLGSGVSAMFLQDSGNAYHFLSSDWKTKTFINGVDATGLDSGVRNPAYRSGLPAYLLTDTDKSAPKKIDGVGKWKGQATGYEYTADKYNYVVAFVPTFMEVTSVTSTGVTFRDNFTNTTVTKEKKDIFYKGIEAVAKEDYVLVYSMNGGNKLVVTEAPFVTGKLVGFDEGGKPILDTGAVISTQGNDSGSSSQNRRNIGIPGTAVANNAALGNSLASFIGKEVKIYTDGKYGLYAEGTDSASDKYLVVMAGTIGTEAANRASTKWNLFATVLFADGSEKEVQISKVDGAVVDDYEGYGSWSDIEDLLDDDRAYTYDLVDGVYELELVDTVDGVFADGAGTTTVADYYKNTGAFKSGSSYYYITEDTTVFVAETGEDVVAVKASDIKENFNTFDDGIVVNYKHDDFNGNVADLKFVFIYTDASITAGTGDYKFARALSDGQYLYDSTEKKFYATIKLFVDGEVATYVSDAVFSSKKDIPSDRSFMAVAFDGDKLAYKSNKSGLDLTSFKTEFSGSYPTSGGLAVLNDVYDDSEHAGKLYAITTSATELRGNLLFTKYVFSNGSYATDEFFIDEDTDIFGVNSVAGAAAANEIVTRSDDIRNVTVVFNYDTRVAVYVLVDAGANFGKETR